MSMTADGRAGALYAAIAQANPKVAQMSAAEQSQLQSNLKAIFGGDLAYIVAQATIVPATFQAPAGAAVVTSGGPTSQTGYTTSSVALTGTGKVT